MKKQHWLWFIDRRKGVQCFLLQGETLEDKVAYAKAYLEKYVTSENLVNKTAEVLNCNGKKVLTLP